MKSVTHALYCGFLAVALSALAMIPAMAEEAAGMQLKDPVEGRIASSQTTIEDQTDVSVTVYNSNRALVRDRRTVKLLPGEITLKFADVAAAIIPETVSIRSLNAPGKLHILEQNYEYDLMSPEKLMEKYVGRQVTLINKSADFSFYEQTATLLSVNNGPIYKIDGNIYLGHPGIVVLPEMPRELIAKPTLVWHLSNEGTDHEVEATYLTGGMNWRADYVLTLNRQETQMGLEGWVTLTNQSGAAYNNARLQLIAGDVNLVRSAPDKAMRMVAEAVALTAGPPPMEQEAFSEFHLYTLARRTTIKENQTKQVSLLRGDNIGVTKKYEFRGDMNFYSSRFPTIKNQNADVFLIFQNREENGLGIPLPAGIVRVYQEDRSGALQFSGEDHIRHTPKNEEVRLTIGRAFDVLGDRTQTDHRALGPNTHESAFAIEVRNRKDVAIQVDVVEPMPGAEWRITEQSHPHVKRDHQTAIFTLDLPADGEVTLTYRVRVTY